MKIMTFNNLSQTDLIDDRHSIIFISGKDIVDILVKNGFNTPGMVKRLLENEYSIGEKQ